MGCEFAQDLLDAEKLVNFGLTREEGVTIGDFAHDASDRPNVDLLAVLVTQEELRGAVPPRRHVIGELGPGLAQLASEAEVTDLELVAPVTVSTDVNVSV